MLNDNRKVFFNRKNRNKIIEDAILLKRRLMNIKKNVFEEIKT